MGVVGFVAAVAVAGVWSLRPPDLPRVEPPLDQFSATRAMHHVANIAKAPHFIGTPAHERVQQYILREIAATGAGAVEQVATVVRKQRHDVVAIRVHNLAARLKGTGEGRAILLAAHYDSAAAAPGAADDGSGVAVLLESLRALKAGPPLRDDVIFLFTDGEEAGLCGTEAFVNGHPWRKDVGPALNFEARGTSGSVWMFRTNPGSGWLVRALAKAAPYPQASSLGDEVFRYMGNNTDLTEFRRAGYPGMDFAFIDHPMYYHSELDEPKNLDPRSVYQQGANAVALVRYLGALDLNSEPRDEAVYHGTAKTGLLVYPSSTALPLALVAAGLTGVAAAIGFRRRRLTLPGLLVGSVMLLLAVTIAFAVGRFGEARLERGLAARYAFGYRHSVYQLAFFSLAVALTSAIYGWLLRKTNVGNLWMGGLAGWAILAVVFSVMLPGVSFAFAWPLLPAACGAAIWLWRGGDGLGRYVSAAAVLLLSAPAVFLVPQLLWALMVAFPIGGAGFVAAWGVLGIGLLVPHLKLAQACGRWWLPLTALAASLVLFAAGSHGRFNALHPRPDTLSYAVDADANRAYWLSFDEAPDAYTSRFLGSRPDRADAPQLFPMLTGTVLQASAPMSNLRPTVVELAASRSEGELRVVQLRLEPRRAISGVYLYLDPGTQIQKGTVDGTPVPPVQGTRPLLLLGGLGEAPAVVELQLSGAVTPLRILAIDRNPGVEGALRPPGFMTNPFNPDTTMVRKTYQFR